MNKGFTLIETLLALSLVMLAVLASTRTMVAALAWTRQARARFRLVEKLDYYKNTLSSLPHEAAELVPGTHERRDGEFRAQWQVEADGADLKRVRLAVGDGRSWLRLLVCRSRFIQALRPRLGTAVQP